MKEVAILYCHIELYYFILYKVVQDRLIFQSNIYTSEMSIMLKLEILVHSYIEQLSFNTFVMSE